MSIIQVTDSKKSGTLIDRTSFLGAKAPDEVKQMVKHMKCLDRGTFRKFLQVIITSMEGKSIEYQQLSALQSEKLSEETLAIIYSGLHKLLQKVLRLPLISLKPEVEEIVILFHSSGEPGRSVLKLGHLIHSTNQRARMPGSLLWQHRADSVQILSYFDGIYDLTLRPERPGRVLCYGAIVQREWLFLDQILPIWMEFIHLKELEVLKEDLQELKLTDDFIEDITSAVIRAKQSTIGENILAKAPSLPKVQSLRWRLDVAISTSTLNRALEPVILMEMILNDGSVQTFEVPVTKFHELRYNVAYMLKEMENLEKRNILKVQD